MERRTILDWMIAPRLRAVPGVTEVNAWGGFRSSTRSSSIPRSSARTASR